MIDRMTTWFAVIALGLCTAAAAAAPIAEWRFDEGRGDIARDSTGNGHDAHIYGATWVKQGDGHALYIDGVDDYVDCTQSEKLPVTGPISIEAWFRPTAKSQGLGALFGEGLSSYFIGYYTHAEMVYWFIGSGGNKIFGTVELDRWNHIAASYDGKVMSLWLNGRLIGSHESQIESFETPGSFMIGTKGRPDLPKFKGMVDVVRVYDRGLTADEVTDRFRAEAPDYGFDPAWFDRVKVTPYYYFDRGRLVVDMDYRRLEPFDGAPSLTVTLARSDRPSEPLETQTIASLSPTGHVEAVFQTDALDDGAYVIETTLRDAARQWPVERIAFTYPAEPAPLPAPDRDVVGPLPESFEPPVFNVTLGEGGGFAIEVDEHTYPFQTRVSWPNGDFNRLSTDSAPVGEDQWRVRVTKESASKYVVRGNGAFYAIERTIERLDTHVSVRDTYTNLTQQDLGLLIYNELLVDRDRIAESRIGGFDRAGRYTEVFSPNIYVDDGHSGLGFLPLDDVFAIQCVLYNNDPHVTGLGTERFALGPGASYTLEWAVYPTGGGDYYDFINTFRRSEGRIGTIDGAAGFFTYGPKDRDQIPQADYITSRALKYGLIHGLAGIADDPQLSIQGVEYIDFSKERSRLRTQADTIHARHPDFKTLIHIAHSLYCTNVPTERYPDARVITEDGKQSTWEVPHAYISEARQDAGWKFWIFYPTPGNSFHDAMMQSVDVLMDDMGMDGAFLDGFMSGYGGYWTFDGRWDGHSAQIDRQTYTITRKLGSVLLLSQPSMIEFCRRIHNKGGTVIANNTLVTRSISEELYIIHDSESGAGPQLHLAPTVSALALPGQSRTPTAMYRNMLENLRWGELYMYYGGHHEFDYKPLAARSYPMTFEQVRSGTVRGPERIVTMNTGTYGWDGDRRLHLVHQYDPRGAPAMRDTITTVDANGVRTRLALIEDASAVIEPIPVELAMSQPVNVRVQSYDGDGLHLLINGRGRGELKLPDAKEGTYRLTHDGSTTTLVAEGGLLRVPLMIDGPADVTIERVQ